MKKLILSVLLPVFLSQRIENENVLDFNFNQCQCLADAPIPLISISDSAFELVKSNEILECPQADGFSLPIEPGIIVNTVGDDIDEFGLTSSLPLLFNSENGLTMEAFVKPLDLVSQIPRTIIVAELTNIDEFLPAFQLSLSFNPFKPTELKVIYTTSFIGGTDDFEFQVDSLSGQDQLHLLAGFNVNSDTGFIEPFACLDGSCQVDTGFTATHTGDIENRLLQLLGTQKVDFNEVAERFQISFFALHDIALDEQAAETNLAETVLPVFPVVRSDLFIEGTEDQVLIPFVNNGFISSGFEDENIEATILIAEQSFLREQPQPVRVNQINTLSVEFNENFFTSNDDQCDNNEGDSGELFLVSVRDVTNQECVLPPISVSVCIVEVNDAPEVIDQEIPVIQSNDALPTQYRGSDIDDTQQFQQVGVSGIVNGVFTVLSGPTVGSLFELVDGVCSTTTFETGTFNDEGIVVFCYQGNGELDPGIITYQVQDSAGAESEIAELTFQPQEILQVCGGQDCEAIADEEIPVEVVLQAAILDIIDIDDNGVVFEITSFPTNGELFFEAEGINRVNAPIQGVQKENLGGSLLFEASFFYTSNNEFFNRNFDGSRTNLVGNPACPRGVENCDEIIEFSVTVIGSKIENQRADIGVKPVAQVGVIFDIGKTIVDVSEADEVVEFGQFTVDFGAYLDVIPVTIQLNPQGAAQVKVTPAAGTEFIAFNSTCSFDEFCADFLEFIAAESVLNQVLLEASLSDEVSSRIEIDLLSPLGDIPEFVDVNFEVEAEAELSIALLGGAAVAGLVLLAISCFAFTRLTGGGRGRSNSDKSGDVELYDEEEKREMNKPTKRVAPPTKPKEPDNRVAPPSDPKKPKRKINSTPSAPAPPAGLSPGTLDDEL